MTEQEREVVDFSERLKRVRNLPSFYYILHQVTTAATNSMRIDHLRITYDANKTPIVELEGRVLGGFAEASQNFSNFVRRLKEMRYQVDERYAKSDLEWIDYKLKLSRPLKPKPKSFVVLMENLDGKVGAILVENNTGQQRVDQANAAVGMDDADAVLEEPFVMKSSEIEAEFGGALQTLPEKPVKFVLYFKSGGAELTDASQRELPIILRTVRERTAPNVSITGHSDKVGNEDYNYRLSLKRAQLVRDLVIEEGVEEKLVEVESHGENNPLVPTPDNVAEPRNRRVEVYVR
ncbi:putative OmpA/MotB domain-containing protein [Magnetofaba australis IT-1]|uniref:Putative OmpA/MotB domain-containing protein n=1 Tax=Magnetofaba australis IT-1 TaxID=1434232 RepID=A0A1Y2K7Q7_9PROT|nr:putative OmpA/MotB domain-containing protein [Magnetofaba australis IT-1]